MTKTYILENALTSRDDGRKANAVASPIKRGEIKKYSAFFNFDFVSLSEHYTIYQLQTVGDAETVQGLVGFRPTPGILECANMETSNLNKHGNALYNGIGKALVALCCKISLDNGMDGFIYFDAKNRLVPYYQRFGAKLIFGLRMVIEPENSKKLIDLYFKNQYL